MPLAAPTASHAEHTSAHPLPIRIERLTKRYGATLALDALDLEVPAGSVYGFLGPNGAGKTTTLRMLMALAVPSDGRGGSVTCRSATAPPTGAPDRPPRPGPGFPACMQGREQPPQPGSGHRAADAHVGDAPREPVGLTTNARRPIGGYSGGMRQRLGIAQAMLRRRRSRSSSASR